ncbi:MAG: glycosyltransferase family 9 protein [Bryobacteraceae bacterium]
MSETAILVIRVSAMGDIIHALPAVASLRKSFPENHLAWLVAPKWIPLLEGNPHLDELIPFRRRALRGLKESWTRLHALKPGLAIDFQGLVQSALAGRAARPKVLYGFHSSVAREPFASVFYTHRIPAKGPHRVERNLQLVEAAGACEITHDVWLPPGRDEGSLPSTPFVLVSPFAGWTSKQWPIENYEPLAERLSGEGLELVANVPEHRATELSGLKRVRVHSSSIAGLIAATRKSTAVVGLDSGPLHLAAALRKPGVGLYGPTDPARTGPYGGSIAVLRAENTKTTYTRHHEIHPSMKAIAVEEVADALMRSIAGHQLVSHS